LDVKEIYTLKS